VCLADFLVGNLRYLTCPGGERRHFSPDTGTWPNKNAARGRVRTGVGVR